MADINQQTEEMARKFEQLAQAMVQYDQLTKSSADQKRDADVQAATGMKNFTKGAAAGADAVGQLASAGMAAGKAMLDGKKGAAAFNDSIDGMAKAAQAAGVALALLIPGGPAIKLLIAGITALTGAVAGLVKESNIMADKLYKSYSGLAKSGAAASDGMTGVFNDAKKLGLSMDQLDSMVSLVGENSKDLALFAGSVFEGRKQFADMGAAMEPYRKQMIAAGLTQEQINEGAMGYLRLQTQMGRSQNMTTKELADGARKYLVEMDGLSKMTGQSRKEMEDAMEAARSEQRFRAKLEEVRLTQGEDAAKRLEKANVIISSQSKEMGQAFRDISTGMLGTEAAQKGMMGTQGELMTSTQKLIAGQVDEFQAVTNIGKAAGQFAKDMNMTAQLGTFNDMATDYAGQLKLGLFAEKDKAEQAKLIAEDQKKQGLTGAKAADGITNQYAENIKQQQDLNKKMETVVFKGIDNALVITNKLGNATDTLATGFEVLGKAVNKLLNLFGLGTKEPKVPAAPTKEQEAAGAAVTTAKTQADEADKKLADQMAATDALKKNLESISKSNDKSAEATAKIAELKKQIAESENKELTLNKEAKIASAKKLEAAAARTNANRAARGQSSTSTATPTPPVGGKQELPAGVAPSTAGGGRGSVAPPAAGAAPAAPTTAQPVSLSPQPLEGEGGKDAGVKLEDVLKFTARSGSQQAFEGLDNNFKKAVIAAAEQYKTATGKPIQINSAKRDPADQERLYEETIKLGTPGIGPTGMKVAKPGRSLHERGHAVDIQQYKDSAAIAAFNAQGLFQKVPNDPVHFQASEGGVFSGPESGYDNITLHGTEAVIPLKNGAVPVRLFGDETASTETQSGMPDFGSMINSMGSTMFAAVQTLRPESISSKFDTTLREEVVEPEEATNETATEAFDTPMSNEPTGLMEFVKEAKEANFAMLAMISELVREQRNANDISTRILQVSSN
jgi:hypothetical protein